MLYVAMTRARDANTAYLYERSTEQEYGPTTPDGPHVLRRGTGQQAGMLVRTIIDTHDDVPVTAHQVAATTPRHLLPERVTGLLDRRSRAVEDRKTAHAEWQRAVDGWAETTAQAHEGERARAASRSPDLSRDSGIEF